jgi:hypothetical protein
MMNSFYNKRLLHISAILGGMLLATPAMAYCPNGSESGGQCWAPIGPQGRMVVIGPAQPNNSYRNQITVVVSQVPPPDPRIKCKAPVNGTQQCTKYYDYDLKKVEQTYTALLSGGLIGEVSHYYPNGKLKSVMNFNKQGRLQGKSTLYWENGQLQSVMNYNAQEKLDGKITHYWENGKLKAAIDYKNGLADGFSHEYDQSGKLIAIWQFERDREVHLQEMNGNVKHGTEMFFRLNKDRKNEGYHGIEWNNGKKVREERLE